MATIIALEGAPRTGKSPTINILYRLMRRNGYTIIQDRRIRTSRDFFAIFEKKNKRVGVTSYGDSVFLIERRLNHFTDNNCSIMVCACHLEGVTKDTVQSYPRCSKQFVRKTLTANRSHELRINTEDANKILRRIESLL